MKTHQQIIDALADVSRRKNAQLAAIHSAAEAERDALRAECAAVGHLWGEDRTRLLLLGMKPALTCVVCGEIERDSRPDINERLASALPGASQ